MTDPVDECAGEDACSWNDRHSERWVQAVEAAPWTSRGGGEWIKVLDCPRCGDVMTVRYLGGSVLAAVAELAELHPDSEDLRERLREIRTTDGRPLWSALEDNDEADAEFDTVPARCNCKHEHDGQPDTANAGCGQYGVIKVPPEA